MKIAITGGIGSGKSYVANLLRERGVEVYDCDSAAKRLMRESAELRQQLTEAIGTDAYLPDGSLNKAAVSRFLLSSDENTKVINGIVHPAVAEDFRQSGIQWMECAILFESGFDSLVDKIVCVTAPLELRIQRIMQRDDISRDQALEWIGKQLPQEELQSRSDICIINDNTQTLNNQITNLMAALPAWQ